MMFIMTVSMDFFTSTSKAINNHPPTLPPAYWLGDFKNLIESLFKLKPYDHKMTMMCSLIPQILKLGL